MGVYSGIASPSLLGSTDAIFQPQPHGVIADNPLHQWCHHVTGSARGYTFFSRGRDRALNYSSLVKPHRQLGMNEDRELR